MSDEILSGADVLPPKPKTAKERAETLAKLTEADKRKKRCCFTGKSPQGLTRPIDDIKVDLENEILSAIREGYVTFITGMLFGTDIWAGNIVVRLKDRFPDLKLIAAVPFPGFMDKWADNWIQKYEILLNAADYVKVMRTDYNNTAFLLRDRWMVDHSSKLIAVYDGESGYTRDMIQYAGKSGVQVRFLRGLDTTARK